jgi:LuxR family transcriptional regulator, maltose regulon positive regulatory protein
VTALMSELLETKLTIPAARVDRVPRPRLTQQFDASLEGPLTLLCAPAGFGKTSLITDWYEQADRLDFPLAWLSVDSDDNDPLRFLTYLISALKRIGDIHSEELLLLLQSAQPPPLKNILTILISRLEALPQRFVLVLDDYHQITSQSLHESLVFLLDHLPSKMRLVITSREDPPLPLSRLRARGHLAEIRANDLRFTADEAAQFMWQLLGVELSSKQIHDLDARTEGWIAGLQLAALAMKGRKDISGFISAFTGSHRYILDYLTDEVLSRQPEALQNFLLQTSILNRLSGPLCNAVTGRNDGQVQLEQIERGNLFLISLDDERLWYRYHHLFADVLRNRLKQAHPGQYPVLHRRASQWFEQNGWVGEAVEHALLEQDGELIARLVEQYGDRLWMNGEIATFLRWLQALPEATIEMHPKLGLNYAFALTLTDNYADAEKWVLQAENALLQHQGQMSENERMVLLARAAVIHTSVLYYLEYDGDIIITSAHQAYTQLPESAALWRSWLMVIIGCVSYSAKGEMAVAESYFEKAIRIAQQSADVPTFMPAMIHLSRTYFIQGKLRQVEAVSHRLIQSATQTFYVGGAQQELSQIRYERNDLTGALADAIEGWETVKDYSLKRMSLDSYIILARLKQVEGKETVARELMQQAVQIVALHNLRQTLVHLNAWQAWLWITQGDFANAARWASEIEPTTQGDLSPALEFDHIILARIQIAQNRLDDAQHLLARLLFATSDAGRLGYTIAICVLQALAARLQGNMAQAVDNLAYALPIAEPEGYVRSFIDEGAPMAEILHEALKRGIMPQYVSTLLAAFDGETPTVARPQSLDWIGENSEPLSERELEVLRLVVDGASNRDIAAALYVSIGTVKKHLNNIFLKLDAHSRTQAIATARKHGFL